jgi:TPR repeat protein
MRTKPSEELKYIKNYFKKSVQEDSEYQWQLAYSERLAKQGEEEAQLNLAFLYYHGIVLSKDFKKAGYWFEQANGKKDKEHPIQSLYFLAQMYAKGEGVKQSYPKAIELYQILLKEMKNIQDDLETQNSDLEEKISDLNNEPDEPEREYQ